MEDPMLRIDAPGIQQQRGDIGLTRGHQTGGWCLREFYEVDGAVSSLLVLPVDSHRPNVHCSLGSVDLFSWVAAIRDVKCFWEERLLSYLIPLGISEYQEEVGVAGDCDRSVAGKFGGCFVVPGCVLQS